MLPPLDNLDTIPEPFEMLELAPEQTIELRPVRWELGKARIHPRDGQAAKTIHVLRLHVAPEDKPTLPHWWDVTSKHLASGLLGYLDAPNPRPHVFTITKHGTAPTARFTLDARPAASV